MTPEEFEAEVRRLEQKAAADPRGYQLKLAAFAALGYLYVFAILLLLAALVGGLIASLFFTKGLILLVKKLLIPIVLLIWLVARSLWVRFEAPGGLELRREHHPELFSAIDEVHAATGAPRVNVVLLNDEFNAAVVQVPRLGLLGWQRNYLLLGLQLMQLMSVEEFKAVLAHEFGHLSGAHGRFGAWIYRVRAFWGKLAAVLQQEEHWGRFLFVPFFSWYAPQFAAWSFVKARQQEYEADQLAAETIGAGSIASALVRLELKGEELSRHFWPGVYADADTTPEPAVRPYRHLGQAERRQFLPDAAQCLERALKRNTSTADTHPCLRERIGALAAAATVPGPVDRAAAEVLFGPALNGLIEHFDASWRDGISQWWRDRHGFVAKARERLAALEGRTLDDAELEECARVTEATGSEDRAFTLYEELLRRNPGHVHASFACGRMLLARGDERGKSMIEYSMARAPDAVLAGCELIIGFLHEQGRGAEASSYKERYWKRQEEEQRIFAERQVIRTSDEFRAHGMSPDALTALIQRIEANGKVTCAYLVEKACRQSEAPLYVVGFEAARPWHRLVSTTHGGEQAQELVKDFDFTAEIIFVPLNRENRNFRKIFRGFKGSRIHPVERR